MVMGAGGDRKSGRMSRVGRVLNDNPATKSAKHRKAWGGWWAGAAVSMLSIPSIGSMVGTNEMDTMDDTDQMPLNCVTHVA